MLYRLLTVLTTSACFGGVVHAQEVPAKLAANAAAPDLLADDIAKYGAMFKRGFFDEIISNVNQKIEALPANARANPDARLLYFRGLAYYKLGWLDLARADLIVAQKAGVEEVEAGLSAGRVLFVIEKRAPFVPPQMEEIREGERVLFRVHTFGANDSTESVGTLLREAHRINRQVFGVDVEATTVYVFENHQQFVAYYKAFHATAGPGHWSAASALGTILFITLRDSEGVLHARDDREIVQAVVVQEYNRVLFRRLMGEDKPLRWFTAGLAQFVVAQMGKGGEDKSAPNSQTQFYGLTKYLFDQFSTVRMQSFINRGRESQDFEGAFAQEFGLTPDQLRENWKRDTARQVDAPTQDNGRLDAFAATTSTYSDADDKKYHELWENAFFDELIFKVNAHIEALPAGERTRPDPRLLWFRGMASYKLGRLAEAKADLTASRNDGRRTHGTGETLESIERRRAAAPPQMEEIRDGERVLFRMHFFGMEGGTVFVKSILPEAYRVSRQMFGTDVEATTVYVFDDYAQFAAYFKAHTGEERNSWSAAMVLGDVALISLSDQNGTSLARDDRDFLKTTIVHEINHAVFNRLMGFSPQPAWFVEGIAQVAGAQVSPQYVASKQRRLERLFRNDLLMPMEKLEDEEEFYAQTALGSRMNKGPDRDMAPDPYTQGYSMAKYLLDNVSTPQLQSFLNRAREFKDFKSSFASEFGMTTAQFYQKWKADTERQLAAR